MSLSVSTLRPGPPGLRHLGWREAEAGAAVTKRNQLLGTQKPGSQDPSRWSGRTVFPVCESDIIPNPTGWTQMTQKLGWSETLGEKLVDPSGKGCGTRWLGDEHECWQGEKGDL